MPDLNDYADAAHQISRDKGFWEDEMNVGEKIALMHSELSEALEEFRAGHSLDKIYHSENGKPEGFLVELADLNIRLFDLIGKLRTEYEYIDFDQIVCNKMSYNASRPHKHGKRF